MTSEDIAGLKRLIRVGGVLEDEWVDLKRVCDRSLGSPVNEFKAGVNGNSRNGIYSSPGPWYNKEATTNLATSKAPAIIITCVLAPANKCDKPNTE